MRQYKFRGKRKDNWQWVYGSLIVWPDGDMEIAVCDSTEDHNKFMVIPETVGQFTGLKDKNGVDIYEGDIVKVGRVGVYEEGTGVFKWKEWERLGNWMKAKAGWYLETACDQIWNPETISVIGNIYELNQPAGGALNMNIDPKEGQEEEVKAPATETEQEQVPGEETEG